MYSIINLEDIKRVLIKKFGGWMSILEALRKKKKGFLYI